MSRLISYFGVVTALVAGIFVIVISDNGATSIKTALSPSESSSLDASASLLRSALVNIICYAPSGSRLRSISGSGIIVDQKGIILTNAHIAQHFLLADRGVPCMIR